MTSVLSRRQLLVGAASLACGPMVRAQEAPTFSSGVKVVNSFVTVHDKSGTIVTDLSKDDFVVKEDGREQVVRYFSRQNDLPLTVGLIVDTTPSETRMLDVERQASSTFFENILRPHSDRAFLIQFAHEVELLQDLTSSRTKLEKALDSLRGQDEQPGRGGGPDSTALSDAIYLASSEVLRSQDGRKAAIVLGDGDHIGRRGQQAMRAAQEADVIVHTIRIYDKAWGGEGRSGWRSLNLPPFGGMGGPGDGGPGRPMGRDPGGPGPANRSDGKKHLEEIARETGGGAWEVTRKQSLEQIYRRIEEELRNQYSLGYTPDENAASGYRKLQIAAKRPGLVVQGRAGYYART